MRFRGSVLAVTALALTAAMASPSSAVNGDTGRWNAGSAGDKSACTLGTAARWSCTFTATAANCQENVVDSTGSPSVTVTFPCTAVFTATMNVVPAAGVTSCTNEAVAPVGNVHYDSSAPNRPAVDIPVTVSVKNGLVKAAGTADGQSGSAFLYVADLVFDSKNCSRGSTFILSGGTGQFVGSVKTYVTVS
jgi:hypothetical protein